ncbi:transcription initiation factor TFIID subunit 4 [Diceros bicornis minor]|uniref:transcription initiation factor TFIID subunit 4 n=1 Tax=Diceros bicornis minor TaxID=77932 RepID=UPI0026E961D2|nr:transcription initiation factor TFIID subunit 4 [Diceros bicornis minor]
MGVEMTRASSCSSHSLLGDTSPRAEGRWDNRGGSGLKRVLPAALSGGGGRHSGDLNANKAAALGAWRSPACGRPLSAYSSQGGGHWGSPGGGGGGVRDPGGATPTLAHPKRRAANGAPAAAGRALQPGTGRPGSGRELAFQDKPPSQRNERAGEGPRPRLGTLRLRALLAPLPSPREAARGGRTKDLGRTAVPAAAAPCTPRPCPSRVRRPQPESGDKAAAPGLRPRAALASLTSSSRLESLGAALAFASDHGPPLPARRRPPALARPPPLPLCHRPSGPARLGAPGLGLPAPPRRAPALSPPPRLSAPSPLTSGGGVEQRPGAGREGPPRRGLRPAATRRPPRSRAGGSDPQPLLVPCRPAPRSRGLRHSAGRWGGGGTPGIAMGESDSPGLSEVSPKANRGLGGRAREWG